MEPTLPESEIAGSQDTESAGSKLNWIQEKVHALVARIQTIAPQAYSRQNPHRRLLIGKVRV
jgi:hypothetical protein